MSVTPTFPIPHTFDNSGIADYKKCPALYRYKHIIRKTATGNTDLIAGGAYAKGMETFRRLYWLEGRPEREAYEAGLHDLRETYGDFVPPDIKAGKSLDRMIQAFEGYFKRWPPAAEVFTPIKQTLEGADSVEMSFMIPIPEIEHPEGKPVLYNGRFDALVQVRSSKLIYVLDDKTTSQMGPNWVSQWSMTAQMLGYTWAARQLGYACSGVLIRGVCMTKEIKFEQVPITFPQYKIDNWYNSMTQWVRRILVACATNDFPPIFDFPCNMGLGCSFREICDASPKVANSLLQGLADYRWNPND